MKPRYWGAFVLLLVGTLHIGALRNGFYWDDRPLILENPQVRSWSQLPVIFGHELFYNIRSEQEALRTKVDSYRPVYNTSFLADYQTWGIGRPWGFHATNLAIHLLNVLLVFLIARIAFSAPLAFFAAAAFGLHPLTVECIHYVAARADSLFVLFVLFAAWIGLRAPRITIASSALMAVAFLLGAMVKESALVFPLFWFAAYAFLSRERAQRNWRTPLCCLGAALGVYWILRLNALGSAKAVYDKKQVAEVMLYFPQWIFGFWKRFFIPLQNMPMQAFEMHSASGAVASWIQALLFYAGSCLLFIWSARKRWAWGLALFWTFLFLAPPFLVTSLTGILNPRYLYAAVAGGAFILAYGAQRLAQCRIRPPFMVAAAVSILLVLSMQSRLSALKYQNEEQFYLGILTDHPHHVEAEYNLGNSYFRNKRWNRAEEMYKEALRHDPLRPSPLNNLGVVYLSQNRPDLAQLYFQRAIALEPGNARYLSNLALAQERLGKSVGKVK